MDTPDMRPTFPEVKMNLVRKTAPATATVVSNDSCMAGKSASFVKHLVLDISGTGMEGQIIAGQSFGVVAPGTDSRGKPHKVRLYSNASPTRGEDDQVNLISTTPKRLIDEYQPKDKSGGYARRMFLGVCSNYLCDLSPGDQVAITGPNGQRFLLPSDPRSHDYLFLATGTGIAPFRGMIMDLLRAPGGACQSRIDLIMGTAYTTDLLYHELFAQLAADHDNFHYHTAISRESRDGSTRGLYIHSLMERDFAHFAPLLSNDRTLVYVCGLEAMRYGLVRTLSRHGLGNAYFKVAQALDGSDPDNWSDLEIRQHVKAGPRSYLEVY